MLYDFSPLKWLYSNRSRGGRNRTHDATICIFVTLHPISPSPSLLNNNFMFIYLYINLPLALDPPITVSFFVVLSLSTPLFFFLSISFLLVLCHSLALSSLSLCLSLSLSFFCFLLSLSRWFLTLCNSSVGDVFTLLQFFRYRHRAHRILRRFPSSVKNPPFFDFPQTGLFYLLFHFWC